MAHSSNATISYLVLDLPNKFWHGTPPRLNEGVEDGTEVAFGKGGGHRGEDQGEEYEGDMQVVSLGHPAPRSDSRQNEELSREDDILWEVRSHCSQPAFYL